MKKLVEYMDKVNATLKVHNDIHKEIGEIQKMIIKRIEKLEQKVYKDG